MAEVPSEGSLSAVLPRSRRAPRAVRLALGRLSEEALHEPSSRFPYSWLDVQKAGLAAGLVDNKIAAFSSRLTAIRFVIPVARRRKRAARLNPYNRRLP